MKNRRRLVTLMLIIISTIFVPNVLADELNYFDITVFEEQNTVNTVTGSGIIYVNANSDLEIQWTGSGLAGGTEYTVQADFIDDASEVYVNQNYTPITSLAWSIPSESLPEEGTYKIRVMAYDGATTYYSKVVTLIVDKTAPVAITGLDIENPGGTSITGESVNLDEVRLTWDSISDTLLSQPYRVFYKLPNRVPVEITDDISYITNGTALINIGPDGYAFFDTDIVFQVSVTDVAYNESPIAEVSFTLDRSAPNGVTDLELFNSADEVSNLGFSNDITRLEWNAPSGGEADSYKIYWKFDDGEFTVLGSTQDTFFEITDPSVTSTDGKITFKVTSIDVASNESLGVEIAFNLDTVVPVFDVDFTDSQTLDVNSVSGLTLNFVEKQSISVTNELNDIHKFTVYRTDSNENYVLGNRDSLELFLRSLSVDGSYIIKVKDIAGNIASYTFTLNQQYPTLPSNKNLTIVSQDTEDLIGVRSNVTITWDKSTDEARLDHYEIYVNGEMIANNITNSGVTGSTITFGFTLDTIKYGDVENYYEVRTYDSEGNYGVYNIRKHTTKDLVKPFATIVSTQSFVDTIGFTVELLDYNRVIDEVYAALYKGSKFITSIPITAGTNYYEFEGLEDNEVDYRIKIEADYEYNSVDYNNDVINDDTVYNLDTISSSNDVLASITDLNVDVDSVVFDLTTTKFDTSDETISVQISNGSDIQTKIIELDTDDLVTVRAISFTGLTTAGSNYQVKVIDGTDVLATANIFTQRDVPVATFATTEVEGEAISVRIVIADDDNAITDVNELVARLYDLNGNLIKQIDNIGTGSNNITFTSLDYYTEYIVKVFADYDLSNNRGTIVDDMIGEFEVNTAKESPTVQFLEITPTGDSILFDVKVTDDYYSISLIKAVLYEGTSDTGKEILLNKGTLRNREFAGLDPQTNYRINIEIIYDLDDGNGDVINNLFYGENVTTLKEVPKIELSNVSITNDSIEISAKIIDANSSYETGFIKLYEVGSNIAKDMHVFVGTGIKTFSFENLDSNTEYKIIVDAEIDLNDGEGVFDQIIFDKEYKTHKDIDIDIKSIDENMTEVEIGLDLTNYNSENVYAKIFQSGSQVGTPVELLKGENTVRFEQLTQDTIYTIVIDYNNGQNKLWEYQFLTGKIEKLTLPTIQIVEQNVEEDILTVKVEINDPDNTLTSNIVEIRICNKIGLCTVQEINADILESGIELPLPYKVNTVEFKVSYDNIETSGTVSDSTEEITVEITEPVDPVDPEEPEEPVDPVDPEPEPKVGFFQRIWNWIKSLFS